MDFHHFDHLQNPIIGLTVTGEIKYFNHVCSLIFKMPPRKISNIKKINELIICPDFDFQKSLKKVQASDSPVISPEISVKVNEHDFTVILKFIPFENMIIMHLQDFSIERQLHEKYKEQILELRSTHEQILKSDKLTAMGELIAGVSHEISSPLTIANDTLLSLSDHLQKKDFSKSKKDLKDLEDEFVRIKQIVSNMQAMARNKEDSVEIVNLNTIIKQSLEFSEELGILKDVEIKLSLLDRSLVMANAGKLQQVFMNMIKNSSDALKSIKNSKIEFKIEKDHLGLKVHIIDNGIGIEDPTKIFEMFFTTKEFGEGTGLGLAISQKIINSFNGSIYTLESDKGAHFILEFPGIDVESFTRTNRYLSGECELEDQKIVIYSTKEKVLNHLFNSFHKKSIILIFCEDKNGVKDIFDSYMGDIIISLEKNTDFKKITKNFLDWSALETEQVVSKIQELIDG